MWWVDEVKPGWPGRDGRIGLYLIDDVLPVSLGRAFDARWSATE